MSGIEKFFGELKDINIVKTERYTMFKYSLNCYVDPNFENLINKYTLVCFEPLDLRIGNRYYFKGIGWNPVFKNLVYNTDSTFIPVQKNDLWQYM